MAQTKASTTSSSGSRLGASVVVRGMIRASGDLEIHGRVEGSIQVEGNLDIDDGARIKSALSGGRVTIRGAVLGDVSGSDSVVLEAGARVVGDLSAPSIGIRPGGLLRGHVASGDLSGARASAMGAAKTSAPRAVRQPPVAAPTKRDAEPPKHVDTPRITETARTEAVRQPEPPAAPHTKPAASLQERRPAARPAPAPRAAAAAPKAEVNDDPLGDLIRQAPPPIMPSLQRGAKAQLKKKAR